MTDKQQIEEMVEVIGVIRPEISHENGRKRTVICMRNATNKEIAEHLYNARYRRVDENAVVMSGGELAGRLGIEWSEGYAQGRKETADKIFDILYQWLDLEQIEKYGFVTIQKFDFLRKFREIFKQFRVEVEE